MRCYLYVSILNIRSWCCLDQDRPGRQTLCPDHFRDIPAISLLTFTVNTDRYSGVPLVRAMIIKIRSVATHIMKSTLSENVRQSSAGSRIQAQLFVISRIVPHVIRLCTRALLQAQASWEA
nr:hypothetical protein CFP56_63746 [Quercus suber]